MRRISSVVQTPVGEVMPFQKARGAEAAAAGAAVTGVVTSGAVVCCVAVRTNEAPQNGHAQFPQLPGSATRPALPTLTEVETIAAAEVGTNAFAAE